MLLKNPASMAIDAIDLLIVDGDVRGNISVVNDSFALESAVGGNFLGNLTISSGSVLSLPITGDFGSPAGSASTVSIGGNVVFLSAKSFNVNMTAATIDTMTATNSTSGDFSGTLTAGTIGTLTGGTGGGLDIRKNLEGDLTITGDVLLPVMFN